ncbi:helix-turn-helix domain-containing protein [Treponema sp.]|uniref:helix-turn-helix domain-containing protein n=1 Tax=Treponema sp. TaxID=166 RepID=UPI00388FB010
MKKSLSYLEPIQPFFELKTNNFYQDCVESQGKYWFYSFSSKNKAASNNVTFLPDGCTNLVIACGKYFEAHMVFNTVEAVSFEMKPDTEYFAIRFEPGENPFSKGDEIKANAGKIIPAETEYLKEIYSLVTKEPSFEQRMTVASEFLQTIETNSSTKELFKQLLDIIVAKNGLIKISQLEELAGYSSRYINHLFDMNAGLSAKQFCNIIKFQLVLGEINKGQGNSFSKIAADYRFYDQSHFIHEFKAYTGMTPSDYSEAMKIAG